MIGQSELDQLEMRSIRGGFLLQDPDPGDQAEWQVVTRRASTPTEKRSLSFAWKAIAHVKSNGILLAQGEAAVGIGGGLPSRVDAVRLALAKAGERAQGAVLASDAFFPFPEGIEVAASNGVTAIVQPGGQCAISRLSKPPIDKAWRCALPACATFGTETGAETLKVSVR